MPGRSTFTATSVPSGSSREMDLRDRRARDRHAVEAQEDFVDRPAVDALERREHLLDRERRHAVLQLRELVGDVGRQEIAARRQHLAELDEDRPERFQRAAQPHRARRLVAAPQQAPGTSLRTPRARSCSSAISCSP